MAREWWLEGICLNLRLAMDVLASYTELSADMLIVGGGGKSQFCVITSYSIHYTKLYEAPREDANNRRGFVGCVPAYKIAGGAAAQGKSLVITSYSIHYTKLYELLTARATMGPQSQILDIISAAVIGGVAVNGGKGRVV